MTDTPRPAFTGASPLVLAVRRQLSGRRGLLTVGAVVLAAGLATNWSWLVAIGVAPLLLSVLPCLAMCAFGLCMMGGRCAKRDATASAADKAADPPVRQVFKARRATMPRLTAAGRESIITVAPPLPTEPGTLTERTPNDA